jgi:DNA-binding HxlR family transcriptional regulator
VARRRLVVVPRPDSRRLRPVAVGRPQPAPAPAGERCPLETALDAIGDRSRLHLVWHLFWGARPLAELVRLTPGLRRPSLRRALAGMERQGFVRRESRPPVRGGALYSLTPLGQSLKFVVGAMYEWGLARQARR